MLRDWKSMVALAAAAASLAAGCSQADEASDASNDAIGYCLADKLYVADIWIDDPVFGNERTSIERVDPDTEFKLTLVDVIDSTAEHRLASLPERDVLGVDVPKDFIEASASSPTETPVDGAFVIQNVLGFFIGGMIDVSRDGSVYAWTRCDGWTDETDTLARWAGTDSPDEIVAHVRSYVAGDENGRAVRDREAELNRLWDIGFGIEPAPRWDERPPQQRSVVDGDAPDSIRDRLGTMFIQIDKIEPVGDPDLVICPVQDSATSGYCFGIDALAAAAEDSIIQIAVLPDEPIRILLGRESLWDKPGHEVTVATIDKPSDAIELRITGKASPSEDLERLTTSLDISTSKSSIDEIDLERGLQYLGGIEPYEDA